MVSSWKKEIVKANKAMREKKKMTRIERKRKRIETRNLRKKNKD